MMKIIFEILHYVVISACFHWDVSFSQQDEHANGGAFTNGYSHPETLALKGRNVLEKFSQQLTTYGDCWEKGLLDLDVGCKYLTEEVHSRLALSFATCFLKKSGIEVQTCSLDVSISSCLRNADEKLFSTYREFFVHTQSICYFLQHKLWQEQTEKTIAKLSRSSANVSKQLEEAQKLQTSMLEVQQVAFQNQLQLIDNAMNLSAELETSRINVKSVFEEFKSTTHEQQLLIFEIFDRIKKLQSVVLAEFTGVYTFLFYFISVIIAYLLTATPRTVEARFWILLTVTINAVVERMITVYSIDEEAEKSTLLYADGPIYHRVWICRKLGCLFSGVILMWCSYRYKDYNVLNNKLLVEIQQQNWDMQKCIQSMKHDTIESTENNQLPNGTVINKLNGKNVSTTQENLLVSCDYNSDESLGYLTHSPCESDRISCSPVAQVMEHQLGVPSPKKQGKQRRKLIKTSTPKVDTKILEEISELNHSSSGRYNFRPRNNTSYAEEDVDETQLPKVYELVKTAMKISRKNIDIIKNLQHKQKSIKGMGHKTKD